MPEKLREFLANLSEKEADDIWDYLDGYSAAIDEMLDLIDESHPGLTGPPFRKES